MTSPINPAYSMNQPLTGVFPAPVVSTRVPTTLDFRYPIGQSWVCTATSVSYVLTSVAGGSATWIQASVSGTGTVETINSLSPTAGNIVLAGTANQITATSAGSTVTLSTPAAFTAPGSVTATTSITATAGDITATLGNVIINGAAKQLRVHGGAVTDFIGTGTLASGTVTIANTNIAATDRIFIQRLAANGSTTLGELSYSISAATSFTVTSLILGTPGSTQTGDTSTFVYFIVRQV